MGATPSKSPDWYPGEPEKLYGECACSQPAVACFKMETAKSSGGTAELMKNSKRERKITNLPVVELTDMKFVANGAYCAVYTCKYRGHTVVAKRVRADLPLLGRQAALANLWTEHDCLRPLCHPNVIDVYGLCRVRCRDGYDDWNEKDVCLLLERLALGTVGHLFGTIYTVEKNLASHLAKSRLMKMLPFRSRLTRALELALALEYLHGGSGMGAVMHRDLKSVNVGFSQDGTLKLMDFGLSKSLPLGADNVNEEAYEMTGEVGSYRYMAPEIVRHEPYNTKADIYSWAILSWEMLAIEKPYAGVTESTFIRRVVVGGERPALSTTWPKDLCQILASAWHPDYKERPTASQIVIALRRIKAQLPARRRSFGKRLSATAGGRRHSWAAGPVVGETSADAAAEQTSRSSVRGKPSSIFIPCSGDNGDVDKNCDNGKNGSSGGSNGSNGNSGSGYGVGASLGDGGGGGGGDALPPLAGPEKRPSAGKPPKRLSFSALLPTLVRSSSSASSTSSSSSKRNSWYKFSRASSSAPAVVAEDPGFNRCHGDDNEASCDSLNTTAAGKNPKPPERSGVAAARRSSVSTVVGSTPVDESIDNDTAKGGQGATPMSGAPSGSGGTGRCSLHQRLYDCREEISDKLAAETKAQMPPSPSPARVRLAPECLARGVNETRGEGLATAKRAGRKTRETGTTGTLRGAPPDRCTGIDASESSVDVSERSACRSSSAKKLWPSTHARDEIHPAAAAAAAVAATEALAAQQTRTLPATPEPSIVVDQGAGDKDGINARVLAVAVPVLA